MSKIKWKTYAFWILLAEAVGALSGWLTWEGAARYAENVIKPPFSPPGIVFPVVWAILYALMGIAAARVWLSPPGSERTEGIVLFGTQLAFNFFWSIFFFNLEAFGFALLWLLALWLLLLWMTLIFRKTDRTAALFQVPYLLWVLFAGYLNLGVWILNP